VGKAGTRLGSRMAWSCWGCLALKPAGIQLVVPILPRLRSLVSSFLKGSERLSLRYYIQCSYEQHTGRTAGEKQEAVMKTIDITAGRRAMNPPMIIDAYDERRKMSKLGLGMLY
jgi:hypothetical protein